MQSTHPNGVAQQVVDAFEKAKRAAPLIGVVHAGDKETAKKMIYAMSAEEIADLHTDLAFVGGLATTSAEFLQIIYTIREMFGWKDRD